VRVFLALILGLVTGVGGVFLALVILAPQPAGERLRSPDGLGSLFSSPVSEALGSSQDSNPNAPSAGLKPADAKGSPTATIDAASALREYMLALINQDRSDNNLRPVALGTNSAAQIHADSMLRNGFLSHWGLDGLKPYMRFTASGGVNYASENASGLPYSLKDGRRYQEVAAFQIVSNAQLGLMQSPGHRKNILDEWHRSVSLGIACSSHTCSISQLFQGAYVQFEQEPRLDEGWLTMSGNLSDGFNPQGVQVWYDEPPHPLTLGQLGATFAYGIGQQPAAFVRAPLPPQMEHTGSTSKYSYEAGADPYKVDPSSPPPAPICDGQTCKAPQRRQDTTIVTMAVTWVTAARWEIEDGFFNVAADLTEHVERLGPGIYTVVLWAEKNGDPVDMTNYSVEVGR